MCVFETHVLVLAIFRFRATFLNIALDFSVRSSVWRSKTINDKKKSRPLSIALSLSIAPVRPMPPLCLCVCFFFQQSSRNYTHVFFPDVWAQTNKNCHIIRVQNTNVPKRNRQRIIIIYFPFISTFSPIVLDFLFLFRLFILIIFVNFVVLDNMGKTFALT